MTAAAPHTPGWKVLLRPAYLVSLVAVVFLIVVSTLLWIERSKRFPLLPSGAFAGEITQLWNDPVRLYLEQPVEGRELFIMIIMKGWDVVRVQPIISDQSASAPTSSMPLQIEGNHDSLQFIGDRKNPEFFSGKVRNSAGEEGSWYLRPLPPETKLQGDEQITALRLYLLRKAELEDVEAQIRSAEALVPRQKAEISRLTAFITEGERLKTKANEKLTATKELLKVRQELLRKKQEEARQVDNRLALSQRVRGMGKLVALSRESLDREWRWVDSMLNAEGAVLSDELLSAVERAEGILAIQKEIAHEQNVIDDLRDELED